MDNDLKIKISEIVKDITCYDYLSMAIDEKDSESEFIENKAIDKLLDLIESYTESKERKLADEVTEKILDSFMVSNDKMECYKVLNAYIAELKSKYLNTKEKSESQ